jgi:hypothetical protein
MHLATQDAHLLSSYGQDSGPELRVYCRILRL